LEELGNTLNRLEIYTKVPPTKEMTEIIIKILVHLISTLAVVTKQVKQGRLGESIPEDWSLAVPLNRGQGNSKERC
jgi:hypothetical protein